MLGAGVIVIIFLVCFNTKTVELEPERKKKKNKKKGNKNQSKQAVAKKNKTQKKPSFKATNLRKKKQKIKLEENENLVFVARAHNDDITGVAWHQSGKYLLSSSKDKFIYLWEDPTKSKITNEFIGSVKTQDNGYFSAINTIITVNDNDKDNQQQQYYDDDDDKKKDDPLNKYNDLSNSVFAATSGCYGLNSYSFKRAATSNKIRLGITRYDCRNYKKVLSNLTI